MSDNLIKEEQEIDVIIKSIVPMLKTHMATFRKNAPKFQTIAEEGTKKYKIEWEKYVTTYMKRYMKECEEKILEFSKEKLGLSYDITLVEKIQDSQLYKYQMKSERKLERERLRNKDPKKRAEKNAKYREWSRKNRQDPKKRAEKNAKYREWSRKNRQDPKKRKKENLRHILWSKQRRKDLKKKEEENAKRREKYRKKYQDPKKQEERKIKNILKKIKKLEDPKKREEENAKNRERYREKRRDPEKRNQENEKRRNRYRNLKREKEKNSKQKDRMVENLGVISSQFLINSNNIPPTTYPISPINELLDSMINEMDFLKELEEEIKVLDDLESLLNASETSQDTQDIHVNYIEENQNGMFYYEQDNQYEDQSINNEEETLLDLVLEVPCLDPGTDKLIEECLDVFKITDNDIEKILDDLKNGSFENQQSLELIEVIYSNPSTSKEERTSEDLKSMIENRSFLMNQKDKKGLRSLKKGF